MAIVTTKVCPVCEKTGEVEVNAIQYLKWKMGDDNIQDVMLSSTADEREQLLSGTHPECWIKLFGKEED